MTRTKRTRANVKRTLTPRKLRFIEEFPKDLNATQAARRAGYSKKTANEQGCRLLKELHEYVSQFVSPASRELAPVALTALERYVQEIERLAYYDPRKFFKPDGTALNIVEIPDEIASSLAGFEVTELFVGSGASRVSIGQTKKFKLVDRVAALSLLGKVHGHYHDKHDRTPSPLEGAATDLLLEMKALIEKRQKDRLVCLPTDGDRLSEEVHST